MAREVAALAGVTTYVGRDRCSDWGWASRSTPALRVRGSWASGRSAPAIVNLVCLPMICLSGILIPLPDSLAAIRTVSPAYHLDQPVLDALGWALQGGVRIHVMVLTTVTARFLGLSAWRFSHE